MKEIVIEIEDTINPPSKRDIKEGKLTVKAYFSIDTHDIYEKFQTALDSGDIVSVSCHFNMSEIIDYAIEFHQNPENLKINHEDKILFDVMREELQSMIEKIDNIEYSDC